MMCGQWTRTTDVTGWDPDRLRKELDWLKKYPFFDERPASIIEFLGPEYLGIETKVRDSIKGELENIMGRKVNPWGMSEFQLAMITGGIGIGKTTFASIILPYLAHWVLCLKDPQDYFNFLPGSRIAFMQMSTSGPQAKEVVFGDIKARIEHSPWFKSKYPYDSNFKNQLRFPKDIWILPGDSSETTFEGYNILGGILDEADSHKITANKDYAEQGYDTIYSRIDSRFGSVEGPDGEARKFGFLLVIGQMKKGRGFAAKKFAEFTNNPEAYASRMAIWESFGWDKFSKPDGSRDSFWYDRKRFEIVASEVAELIGGTKEAANLIEIPQTYRQNFINNPEKALRDLAGYPPAVGSPFISLAYKVDEARHRWIEKFGADGPVDGRGHNAVAEWFKAREPLKRVVHIDMAVSGDGDSLGIAMGHVPEVIEMDGERKPFIVIDLLMRIHAPSGQEIFLGDVRRIIYDLKFERRFNIKFASLDGFQSTDTVQQFNRKRIHSEVVSVDKKKLPYEDLREALYEDRICFPPYAVKINPNDTEYVDIAVKELTELVDNGDKIDHPPDGSKDVADAMAGVTYTLMGNRAYHRNVRSLDQKRNENEQAATGTDGLKRVSVGDAMEHPALRGLQGLRAPTSPGAPTSGQTQWRPPQRRR